MKLHVSLDTSVFSAYQSSVSLGLPTIEILAPPEI